MRTPLAALLAKYLGGDEATYYKRVTRKSGWSTIERKVELERAKPLMDAVKAASSRASASPRTPDGSTPTADLACQVLGYVGVEDRGLAGSKLQ